MSNDENPNQSIDKKSENDKPDSTHSQVEKKVEAKQQPPPSKSTGQSFHERMLAPKIKSDSKNMDVINYLLLHSIIKFLNFFLYNFY